MTSAERTSKTAELFEQALARPAEERSAFLAAVCAGDAEMFGAVNRLLENTGASTGDFVRGGGIRKPPSLPDSAKERYQDIEFIDRGGMGVVFRARDRQLGEVVALKMLDPALASDEEMLARLKNEIRVGREITHKNVCRIHGWEEFEGTFILEMEYVEGETLRHTLDHVKGASVPQGLTWAREICSALAAAHEKGVVHRDLKPGNIMVDSGGHIKVMDFGIATSVEAGHRTSSTRIGTDDYMAPEQAQGRPVGKTTDIYALGLVLYEVFTGRRHSECRVPPREVNPYIPRHIDRAISKCLGADPRNRFVSAEELMEALSRPDAGHDRVGHRTLWIAVLSAVLVAAAIGLLLWFRAPATPQHDGEISALAYRSDGQILVSGSDDRTIKLWKMPDMRLLHTLAEHDRGVTAVALSAGGRYLASASQDRTAKIWNVASGQLQQVFKDKLGLTGVALSRDGRLLASSGDNTIKIWNVPEARLVRVLDHDDYVEGFDFSPDARLLASATDDEAVRIWDVGTGKLVGGPLRHDEAVERVAFSPDGRFVASGDFLGTVKIWSTSTWLTVQTLSTQAEAASRGRKSPIASLSFNSTGSLLLAATSLGRVKLWEAPVWREVVDVRADLNGSANTWTLSPDGRSLAIGTIDGYIKIRGLR
jgi:hypothetical protein